MPTVVVTGDLIWDFNLAQQTAPPIAHHEPLTSTVLHLRAGGAWYVSDLVKEACSDLSPVTVLEPVRDEKACLHGETRVNHAYQVWKPFSKVDGEEPRVWRIDSFLGCHRIGERAAPPKVESDTPAPDVLVIDDLSLGFAQSEAAWPAALRKGGDPKAIILKTTSVPGTSPLWKRLLKEDFAARLTVVISATLLRTRGAAISRGLSWDRTIEEIVAEFEQGLSSRDFGRCRRVVVHFGDAGAASFTRDPRRWGNQPWPKGTVALTKLAQFERFVYHPEEVEGVWRGKHPGTTFGTASLVTASLVRHTLQSKSYPLFVALARALAATRTNHELGGGTAEEPLAADVALRDIEATFHPRAAGQVKQQPEAAFCSAFTHDGLSDLLLGKRPARESDLLTDATGVGYEYVAAKANEVVIWGVKKALRAVPKARYGKYVTVDRQEIERINAIRNLIVGYRDKPEERVPLSIAVFGPPGSGKSFAVGELAEELFGRRKSKLKFNLARATEEELRAAFHRVRDSSLHGHIPLVFWDEFDAGKLKWLQHFLEPMNDGTFTEGSIAHPFAKAIFVFAGGTCNSFEHFDRSRDEGDDGKAFRESKGPDFISRLRGYVNIKGPNPQSPDECEDQPGLRRPYEERADLDPAHLIRRAVMLRVALERSYPGLIDPKTGRAAISAGVVRGFLRVADYLHGARSLSAIVTMSSVGQRPYNVAALPSRDLLRLHVSDDFVDRVQEGELEVREIEVLAAAIHRAWWHQMEAEGQKDPRMMEHAELSDEDQEANRKPARLVRGKLLEVRCEVVRPGGEVGAARGKPFERFSDAERNRLMDIEHDIWLRDHLLDGWDWGTGKGKAARRVRLHRDVARFSKVPRRDQEFDRVIVESIPKALMKNGYTLVRRGGGDGA